MADDKSTTATDDTGLSDEANPSTTDDDQEDLESSDISWDDGEQEPDTETDTEDEPAATDSDEVDESDSEEDVADTDETPDTGDESTEAENPDEADGKDTDPEAERKRHNDEMAKARQAAKKARDEADAVRKEAEEANIKRYLEEAADDEAELARRQLDVEKYRMQEREIDLNQRALQTEIMRAYAEIDLFKTGTPAVQKRLLRALDQFEGSNVVKDKKGRPVEIKGSVYQHLQAEAESIIELLGEGARQQDKDKSTQKARTLQTPVRAPKKPKVDPHLAGFDEAVEQGW